jgi:hypothetical protein
MSKTRGIGCAEKIASQTLQINAARASNGPQFLPPRADKQ